LSDVAIRVEGLSKRYRIGLAEERADTLASSVANLVRQPVRNFRKLASLTRFSDSSDDAEDIIWALRDVHLDIPAGQVIGLIGSNGAGKSTLLKILSRITEPTSGSATIKGRVSSLLEVGTGFHPELTGRENVYLNGSVLGMRRSDISRRFDEILAFAEVEKFIDTPVKRYSSGMQVRLAFSVAAHLEPEVMLIDEVLAVGDAAFQKKCLGRLDGVAQEGRTVVFVSHNMSAVRNLCERAVLLEHGSVKQDGQIDEVMNTYLNVDTGIPPEQVWDDPTTAPGDDRVKLRSIRVTAGGRLLPEIDYSSNFDVEVNYQNHTQNLRVAVSVHIRNSRGDLVFTSGNTPDATDGLDPWYGKPQPVGLFKTTCTVPGRLLNEGAYSVSVFLVGAFVKDAMARAPEVVSFQIKDMRRGEREYQGEWQGIIRPILKWHTESVEGHEPASIEA